MNSLHTMGKRRNYTQKICTPREQEVFEYLLKNYSTKEIAFKMNISEKTVRNHISNVILKLNVNSRTQAVLELLRCQQLDLND